jgi:histidine triad (HIT) family protein
VSNPRPCAFDPIVAGTAPAHLVLEETELVAFLDARPVFPGHVLVVPRRHHETVADLPPGMAALLWDAGTRVATAQRRALGAAGTFFGLNDIISQSVPHVHLHVVPRRPKDGLRGFFWPRQRYGSDGEAAAVAAALREALEAPGAADRRPGAGPARADRARVSVRDARPDDAELVARLLAGGSIRASEDVTNVGSYRSAIEEISAGPGTVLVAVADGAVVGVCQLLVFRHIQQQGGRCAEIESMHVAEDIRGRGVGSVLLQAAVQRARDAGCYRIQLTSHKARGDAHRFYTRHGFVASHEGFKLYF